MAESTSKQAEKNVFDHKRLVCTRRKILVVICFYVWPFLSGGFHSCPLLLVFTVNWGGFRVSPGSFKGSMLKYSGYV